MSFSVIRNSFSTIALLILVGCAHFFVDMMLGIWPIYKSLAELDIAKAGMIVAVGAFIGEGSQLIFGALSDKGYRKLLIIFGLMLAVSISFLVYVSSYFLLFVLYLLTCLGSGSFHPCAASLINSLVPGRRNLMMAIFAAAGSLGLATSQLIFTNTYAFFDGHTLVLAVPPLCLAALLVFYRFPQVISSSASTKKKATFKDFAEFYKNPMLRTLYFSQVANQSILWGTIFILPDALKNLGHTEWVCFGGGHLCLILGAACMVIPAGYLADLYSTRQVMIYAGFISFIAFYFILFFANIPAAVLLIALFVLGATLALMNPLAVALGNRLEPTRSGAVSAFLMGLVWCVSEAVGPGGVGLLSTVFEDHAAVKAMGILGILFILQIYSTFLLPKKVTSLEV